jgi:sugar/nucleoside kinase (ribokinase family)
MSLLVVGSIAYDSIETPFGKADNILGGSGTFISLAASFFDTKPLLVSVAGSDFNEEDLDLLQQYKIDVRGLQIKSGQKTMHWSVTYNADMGSVQHSKIDLNVTENFDPIIPEPFLTTNYLMLGNISPIQQYKVIKQLNHRPEVIVLDTMNYWINNFRNDLLQTLKLVDILAINSEEAMLLSGEYSIKKAARKILMMGPSFLAIKKGEHGVLLFHQNHIFFAPGLPLEEVFDPTGAGDTFAGGLIGYLAKTRDLSFENIKNSVVVGSAMASFVVEKFGIERLLSLTKEDIYKRAQKFSDLVKFDYKL